MTSFNFGYAALLVLGAQYAKSDVLGCLQHLETLQYLLSNGVPPDVEDICGLTALQYTTMTSVPKEDLALTLLKHGANVNHQNRFGEVELFYWKKESSLITFRYLFLGP